MISRFYIEEYLSFDKLELEFNNGLIVFSGPSGAGKSILMNSILSLFGNGDTKNRLSEISIENINIKDEVYDINNDEFSIKQTTQNKTRYYINNQTISKKQLNIFSKKFFKHLHLKDTSDFDSLNILNFIDFLSIQNDTQYKSILQDYKELFTNLIEFQKQLDILIKQEEELEDLKELARIKINKIESIDPKEGEYEELKELKELITKKDKLDELLKVVQPFLDNSHKISQALDIINVDSINFTESINEINNSFESFYDKVASFDDENIENTISRIENLSNLIKEHGTITNALEYKEQKKKELESYENITFEKEILIKNISKLESSIQNKANQLTKYRKDSLQILQQDINKLLKYLYLENLTIKLEDKPIDINGKDHIIFRLNNIELTKISSGEFNRLRLALLTSRSIYEIDNNGILFLDEIDANLSGKESQSIAKVLQILSRQYQIFAISHQPQLSSIANQHFLVYKENNISKVKLLDNENRILELARMISGKDITNEAIKFAKQLLNKGDK